MRNTEILIVEDDGILALFLTDMLDSQKYAVLPPVATGEEAVKIAREKHPGVIIMDIQLAGEINGIQAASQIAQLDNIPIIFLTSHAQSSVLEQAKSVAPYGYLIKPVSERELTATIETALFKHNLDEKLRESEARFRHVADTAPVLIWTSGVDANCDYFNQAWLDFTGRMLQQEINNGWVEGVHPDDYQRCMDTYLTSFDGRIDFKMEYRLRKANGDYGWLLDNGVPRFTPAGEFVGYIGSCIDITDRKNSEYELKIQRDFAVQVMNTMGQGLTITDEHGRFEFVNQAYARMLGKTPEDLFGKTPSNFTLIEDQAEMNEHSRFRHEGKTTTYESRLIRSDGNLLPVIITGVPRSIDGPYTGAIAVITDLTAQKKAEADLRQVKEALENANRSLEMALEREKLITHTDPLTHVNNQRYVLELAEHEFDLASRYQQPLSIIVFDIDHFKIINDTYGRSIGDMMITIVTEVVQKELRSADILGRIGGDEFVIILPMCKAPQAYNLAESIRLKIASLKLGAGEKSLGVTLSLGVTELISENSTESVDSLIRRSNQAMYQSKKNGRNQVNLSTG